MEKKVLKQEGFKIICTNLFISEKSLNFLLTGTILKSPISVIFSYVMQKKLCKQTNLLKANNKFSMNL